MHSRPMFPILETQVGDGWVGDIDYTKQATKQDSNFLVDWVRVYQSEGQPVTRFDDLDGAESGAYRIAPASRTEGLTAVSNGDAAWQNKNNFYYGGQPRYETSRSHAVPLMQGRFALRLRAHKHSAESGRMLLPAASDPLQVRLCRRIGEIARRRDDVAVAVHNGAMPEIRNDTPAEPVGECAVPRVRALLSAWWEANARDLPWRFGRATPWGVLVSEVMSQQTQMSRVVRTGLTGCACGRTSPRSRGPPRRRSSPRGGGSATRAGRCGCRSAPAWCSSNTTAGFRKPTTS